MLPSHLKPYADAFHLRWDVSIEAAEPNGLEDPPPISIGHDIVRQRHIIRLGEETIFGNHIYPILHELSHGVHAERFGPPFCNMTCTYRMGSRDLEAEASRFFHLANAVLDVYVDDLGFTRFPDISQDYFQHYTSVLRNLGVAGLASEIVGMLPVALGQAAGWAKRHRLGDDPLEIMTPFRSLPYDSPRYISDLDASATIEDACDHVARQIAPMPAWEAGARIRDVLSSLPPLSGSPAVAQQQYLDGMQALYQTLNIPFIWKFEGEVWRVDNRYRNQFRLASIPTRKI